MLFLVKCVFWLGVVFMLIGGRGAQPPSVQPDARAAASKARESKTVSTEGRSRGALSSLADQAAETLADAARGQCLAHPVDCLLAAERFGLGAVKPEPARR